jgi:hypothetical protein
MSGQIAGNEGPDRAAPACAGQNRGPVFVVGMNGSGTSMMLDCLGRHPALYAVPDETLMMPFIIGQARRFGDFRSDENFLAYWQFAIDQMPVLQRVVDSRLLNIPTWWQSQPRNIAGVFDGIFGKLAAEAGKQRWCEKTPDHVQHLDLLSEVFKDARFVHMIRDGREVASSLTRRQRRHPELVIYRWKNLVKLGQLHGARLGGRYLEVTYEELTSNPRRQMERLCDFVGLEFDERVLQSQMPQSPGRKQLAKGALGAISPNPVKWREYFDSQTLLELEQIAGRMLEDLGYDVVHQAGDKDPGRLRRKYWRTVDFVRVTNDQRKRNKRYRSWKNLASKILFSLKEYRTKRY